MFPRAEASSGGCQPQFFQRRRAHHPAKGTAVWECEGGWQRHAEMARNNLYANYGEDRSQLICLTASSVTEHRRKAVCPVKQSRAQYSCKLILNPNVIPGYKEHMLQTPEIFTLVPRISTNKKSDSPKSSISQIKNVERNLFRV